MVVLACGQHTPRYAHAICIAKASDVLQVSLQRTIAMGMEELLASVANFGMLALGCHICLAGLLAACNSNLAVRIAVRVSSSVAVKPDRCCVFSF